MALDEPKETDDVYDVKGHKLVVDKELMKLAQTIKVDFSGIGFNIDSKIDFGASACSSCGTEGSCCS